MEEKGGSVQDLAPQAQAVHWLGLALLPALCHRALPRPLASGNSCISPGTVLKLHAGVAQGKSSSRRLTKRKKICV